MALIKCSNCGNNVSDKATICPHCQFKLMSDILEEPVINVCEDCGTELSSEDTVCPVCGCPVEKKDKESFEEQPQKVEITSIKLPKAKKSAKKYIIISAILAVLVIVGVVATSIINKNKAEKISEDYIENLKTASTTMLSGAVQAESAGNLIKSVWYNTIYEERDSKTDKFTRNSWGSFNDDFNDSLTALFADSSFKSTINSIKDNKDTVAKLMKSLQNPPEEYKDAYIAIKAYYDSYLELTSLAISPSGSLQTFSNNFNKADSETVKCYEAMDMYID